MGFGALRAGLAILAKRKASASTNADAISADVEGAASIAGGLGGTMSQKQGFLTGLYTNLLNPKALVFFLTLFSALITPSVTTSTKIASAILLLSLSLAWFGFLAVMLSKAQVQLKLQRLTPIIDAIIGVIFMSVALAIYANLLLTA